MKTKLLSFDTWVELSDRKQYEIYTLVWNLAKGLDEVIEKATEATAETGVEK